MATLTERAALDNHFQACESQHPQPAYLWNANGNDGSVEAILGRYRKVVADPTYDADRLDWTGPDGERWKTNPDGRLHHFPAPTPEVPEPEWECVGWNQPEKIVEMTPAEKVPVDADDVRVAAARVHRLAVFRYVYDATMDTVLAPYPAHEVKGWAVKRRRAESWRVADAPTKTAYLSDPDMALLVNEASATPDVASVDALAVKIDAKAQAWEAWHANCTRIFRAATAAVELAGTVPTVEAVTMTLPPLGG